MNIETRVYRLLNSDKTLIELLSKLRQKKLEDDTGIWKHDIPENYRKQEYAPFIRISPVYEADVEYSDDYSSTEEQRVQLSFWCKTDTQAYEIKEAIESVLKGSGLTRYTINENPRYKDPDIDLLINHIKFRYFDWEI